jgi:hypothetical protein
LGLVAPVLEAAAGLGLFFVCSSRHGAPPQLYCCVVQEAEAQKTAALGGAWGTSGGQMMFISNNVEVCALYGDFGCFESESVSWVCLLINVAGRVAGGRWI